MPWIWLQLTQKTNDAAQLTTNRFFIQAIEVVPLRFQRLPMNQFHVDEHVVSFHAPPKDLRDWNLVAEDPLDHPKILGFCNIDMSAKLDEDAQILEYHWHWLRAGVVILR